MIALLFFSGVKRVEYIFSLHFPIFTSISCRTKSHTHAVPFRKEKGLAQALIKPFEMPDANLVFKCSF